jgi:chromatin remodeling complex protein RSC6
MSSAAPKSVAKKTAPAKTVAAPVAAAPVAAPVAEAPKAAKAAKAPKAAAAPAAAAPVVVASTPVEQAAATVVAGPTTTLDEDLKTVTTQLTTLRETVTLLLGQVKKLDKRVHREIKDARKRKRRAKVEEGPDAPKRAPSIFERPVQVTDELCAFLVKPKGTLMSRSEVTKGVNNYVKEKSLKNKHDIKPDAALKKLLLIGEGEPLTYFNLQRYLNRHYVKAVAPAPTA